MYPEEVKNFIKGDYTTADEKFVRAWLAEDPKRQEVVAGLKEVWEKTGSLQLLDDADLQVAWRQLQSRIDEMNSLPATEKIRATTGSATYRPPSGSWRILMRVAAVLVMAIGIYSVYIFEEPAPTEQTAESDPVYRTVRSDPGELVTFRMRDNSRITLNAGSSVTFDNAFGKEHRTIELQGEAYFEVNNKQADAPFIVITRNSTIRDIGTSFNIKAYREDSATEVAVVEGLVEVRPGKDAPASSDKVALKEGQMINVNSREGLLAVKQAPLDIILGWMDKKLIIDNEPFGKVAHRLERYFDVAITVEQDSLKSKIIKASFQEENMEDVMEMLATSLGADVQVLGSEISFTTGDQNQ